MSETTKLISFRLYIYFTFTFLFICCDQFFHRQLWYRTLSLCYACIQSAGIILIPQTAFVPNFISFVA